MLPPDRVAAINAEIAANWAQHGVRPLFLRPHVIRNGEERWVASGETFRCEGRAEVLATTCERWHLIRSVPEAADGVS